MRSVDEWLASFGTTHPSHVLRGLDRVREVARRLEVNPPAPTTAIIAGTNGKGSTLAVLEALLVVRHRVGATISPHMHRFNERARVDGEDATDAELIGAFEAITEARGDIPLSYFEFGILAALYRHRTAGCDVSLLEVGLGGRLDAVNIVDGDVTVITSIGLDHQEYLGDTRELIGAEKAGILRRGVPLVFGGSDPPTSILDRAAALDAPVLLAGRDFGLEDRRYFVTDAAGGRREVPYVRSQVDSTNVATALQAAELIDPRSLDDWAEVAPTIRNPGRFEVVTRGSTTYVLDVAHNLDGARFLCAQVAARFGCVDCAVVGTLADKDVASIVHELDSVARGFAFVDTTGVRGQRAVDTAARAGVVSLANGTLEEVLDRLGASTSEGKSAILVLGSFDLVERMRDWLA